MTAALVVKEADGCGLAPPPESRVAMATTSIIKGSSCDRPGNESSETNWKWFPHKREGREENGLNIMELLCCASTFHLWLSSQKHLAGLATHTKIYRERERELRDVFYISSSPTLETKEQLRDCFR